MDKISLITIRTCTIIFHTQMLSLNLTIPSSPLMLFQRLPTSNPPTDPLSTEGHQYHGNGTPAGTLAWHELCTNITVAQQSHSTMDNMTIETTTLVHIHRPITHPSLAPEPLNNTTFQHRNQHTNQLERKVSKAKLLLCNIFTN